MKQRRVGTLTFGGLMIVLGIAYLCVTVFKIPIQERILDFWPLILVSIGAETLVLNQKALKNDQPLKYDFLSFILIIIMIFFAFGLYTFSKLLKEFLNPASPIYFYKVF